MKFKLDETLAQERLNFSNLTGMMFKLCVHKAYRVALIKIFMISVLLKKMSCHP